MAVLRVEREIAGKILSIETGRFARQAHGSAMVQYGETVVLSNVVSSPSEPEEDNFFPLTVDYRERTSAAGKFPGGFIKREGRPTNKEILTMRMIDRPIRPLFPKGYFDEVQIMGMVLSADQQNDPDILTIIASSAALSISPIPFMGPIAAVRVGRLEGQFVLNPTHSQLEFSDMDLVLSGTKDSVNMIELGCQSCSEDVVLEAMKFGHEHIKTICGMIDELTSQVKPVKQPVPVMPPEYNHIITQLFTDFREPLRQAKQTVMKQERNTKIKELRDQAIAKFAPVSAENHALLRIYTKMAFEDFEEKIVCELILEGKRPDGRGYDDVRTITCEVGMLPRTHGSAVFTRGETQAMVTTTLGTTDDEQIVDGLAEEYSKKFMLDYNFPPFSVGEVRPVRGPGRREIGHGALAERSLAQVLPAVEDFPYTIRLVSDILESNGSSSMASVCGGTLSLMDAGVPITAPVAGISIGMVSNSEKRVFLTDIIGDEDHYGDMDFKVAGTEKGITGIQLDLKMQGLPFDLIAPTLEKAKTARLKILGIMLQTLATHRPSISTYAPKLITIRIDPAKIGKVIGPGGKMIRKLQEETGATIEIEDDGTIYLSSPGGEGALLAKEEIEKMCEEIAVGKVYTGKVISIKDFGAFIEVLPGQDGLCHISELSNKYIGSVTEVVNLGDEVTVKVIGIDDQGRIKLSMKAMNPQAEGEESAGDSEGRPERDRGDRQDRGERRGGGDRGGRGGRR
ncbi:MAG: polyribonucleotide nucleotidyltransferase [Phycisphaerae bacterium]